MLPEGRVGHDLLCLDSGYYRIGPQDPKRLPAVLLLHLHVIDIPVDFPLPAEVPRVELRPAAAMTDSCR